MILESQYRKLKISRLSKIRSVQIAKKTKENNSSVTSTIWLCEFLNQRFDLKLKLKEIELKYTNPKIIEELHYTNWAGYRVKRI
jgi:hypothetical protein